MKNRPFSPTELATLTAADLMTSPVVTVRVRDSVREVARLFIERNISGALVLGELEQPLGVITKTDLAHHEKDRMEDIAGERDKRRLRTALTGELVESRGLHLEAEEETIESWMTPFICDVAPDASLAALTKRMVRYGVHHVFVRDKNSKRVEGIVTSFDILWCLSRALNDEPVSV